MNHSQFEIPNSPFAIETRALTKRFSMTVAVDGVDLRVPQGQIYGLVGPDGAGKTTLIRMLCGILAPTSGDAAVAGLNIVTQSEEIKARIGYMSQRFTLYGDLSVRENLDFFAEMHRVPRAERDARAVRLLEFSRLAEHQDRRAENLSGGMKQKLALACTLIHRPDVLFLDEPTTGVDPVSRREFWKILYDLLREGVTLFVATPYMDEAERCAHVGFLSKGRLLVSGTPLELKHLLTRQIIEMRAKPRKIAQSIARAVAGEGAVQIFGDSLHIRTDDADALIEKLHREVSHAGADIVTLRRIAPSMEDVFMEMTNRNSEIGGRN